MPRHRDGILQIESAEAEELIARLRGISATCIALRPDRYAGRLSGVDLGDIGIQVLRSAPMLMLASAPPGSASLMQLLDGSEEARLDGRPLYPDTVAVFEGVQQHAANYPHDFACAVLRLDTDAAEAIGLAGSADLPGDTVRLPQVEPQAHASLAEIGRAIEATIASDPAVLRSAETRSSLRATLLDAAEALLAPGDGIAARSMRDARTRQRIVHRADEYLRANPARPVYTEELCTALGTSATRLHQAFHSTFGISPHRYLKMRRMGMVRAMLLSRSGPWKSVKAAALSHGFWHLSQFAHDYRAFYGEAPSATLARARPGAEAPGDIGI